MLLKLLESGIEDIADRFVKTGDFAAKASESFPHCPQVHGGALATARGNARILIN